MARLPNGCSRMLCALLQFGSFVYAVNSPSPATARTRRSDPFTALSNRFSSLSSSTRSWPETTTNGVPIMSSQKIGPNSLASRARFCVGALESSDSMLPTTGFFGGCGIGLSLFVDAIAIFSPAVRVQDRHPEERASARVSKNGRMHGTLPSFEARRSRRAPRDDAHPNLRLRHSISLALTSSGFSCCVQWPLPRTRYFSRSGTIFSMPSAEDGGSTWSFSAMIISEGTRTVWSRPSERRQLRDMLRYQLMPPVKPVFVKVSTKTFLSSGDRIGVRGSCRAS